ncbi:hypothetical protein [Actinomadura rubrisoli]|uniref:hypothetical protein n=1 Tax=Actinomadura rubrisoli TaxID=2530368 RepID=UPI001FB859F1|nr:hypothetical protein [Actinomadura rubrisoli]
MCSWPTTDPHTRRGADHYRVFTPYRRAWDAARRRPVLTPPKAIRLPAGTRPGPLPRLAELTSGASSPGLAAGGERAGRERMTTWPREATADYEGAQDDLAADRTSRLSTYLKFGCVPPLELAMAVPAGFRHQLTRRDFHHQVAAAFPALLGRREDGGTGTWTLSPPGATA